MTKYVEIYRFQCLRIHSYVFGTSVADRDHEDRDPDQVDRDPDHVYRDPSGQES